MSDPVGFFSLGSAIRFIYVYSLSGIYSRRWLNRGWSGILKFNIMLPSFWKAPRLWVGFELNPLWVLWAPEWGTCGNTVLWEFVGCGRALCWVLPLRNSIGPSGSQSLALPSSCGTKTSDLWRLSTKLWFKWSWLAFFIFPNPIHSLCSKILIGKLAYGKMHSKL